MQTQKANFVQWLSLVMVAVLTVGVLFNTGNVLRVQDVPEIDYEKIATIVAAAQAGVVMPSAEEIASLVDVENADNDLLNEFLESHFADDYTAIEEAAEKQAKKELKDDKYEIVVNYLATLVEGLDEDSVDVDIEDVDVEVTTLGLDEDEDKSATVIFEIEVEYELEEGVVEDYKKDFIVTYNVVFDEGDLDDEDVELISIQ